jgi:hypothetical protein
MPPVAYTYMGLASPGRTITAVPTLTSDRPAGLVAILQIVSGGNKPSAPLHASTAKGAKSSEDRANEQATYRD